MSATSALAEPPLLLRIEKPIYGGAGLARVDGKAVFVPYTLPGELVTATITHSKASFAEASVERVIEPSPNRVEPRCPFFGTCGGCHYQHAAYPAQLAIKAAILEETLTRAGLTSLPKIVSHAGEPFGYRNRIRLHLDPVTSAPSYRQRGAHRLIAVNQCPIAAPELEQALVALAKVGGQQRGGSHFSQAEWSVNHDGSELLLALWLRAGASVEQAASRLTRLCEALQPRLPGLRGAAVHADSETDELRTSSERRGSKTAKSPVARRRLRGGRQQGETGDILPENPLSTPVATWGAQQMIYTVAGCDYRVSLGAFFQVDRPLLGTLVSLATGGRRGAVAWDLYAGAGLFSRVLAAHFSQVVAVEAAPVSGQDLRHNLDPPHQAIRSGTLEFLRGAAARLDKTRRGTPNFVLVDPPRAGLGEEVTRLLAQIGPAEITYVSCDPATLSRDLRTLVDSGYKLQQLHLIDLFPQTFHLETVAMLSRL